MDNILYYELNKLPNTAYTDFINLFYSNFLTSSLLIMFVTALILSLLFALQNNTFVPKSLRNLVYGNIYLPLLIAISIASISFFRFYTVVDEGHINFSHAYNLYHYGIFSFSPDKLSDGTNEVLAMLLITPFAQTYESIWVAYFMLIWISLIIVVVYVFKIVKQLLPNDCNLISAFIPLSLSFLLFCKNLTGITLSGGFANILSAALFLITLHSLIKGNYKKMSLFAFLCAFSRLDSILWLFAVFVADTIAKRKINWHLIISSLVGLFTLLLFFKLYYGHWIPTPILMKGTNSSSIYVFYNRLIYIGIISFISIPTILILLKSKINYKIFFILLFIFTFLGSCVIIGTDHNYQWSILRYILPFLFIMLIGMILASQIVVKFINSHYKFTKKIFVFIPVVLITALSIMYIFIKIEKDKSFFIHSGNYNRYQVGKFLPNDLSLMSSEISQMFYARENRNVIDAWGFTNRNLVFSQDKKCYFNLSGSIFSTHMSGTYKNKLISTYNPDMVFVYENIFTNAKLDDFSYENIANNIAINYLDTNEIDYIKSNYKIVVINYIKDEYYNLLFVKNDKIKSFNDYMLKRGLKKSFNRLKFPRYNVHRINTCDNR